MSNQAFGPNPNYPQQPPALPVGGHPVPPKQPWYRKTWVLVAIAFFVGGGVGSAVTAAPAAGGTATSAATVATSATASPTPVATPMAAQTTSSADAAAAASVSAEAEASASASAEASRSAEAKASKEAAEEEAKAEKEAKKAAKALKDPSHYKEISSRKWALLEKDADSHVGDKYVIYGHVTQADSATGTESFRANTGGSQGDWYDYDVNTIVTADAKRVKKVVSDDLVKMYVEVVSSYSYDTSLGGTATAVLVQAHIIKHLGEA